MKIYPKKSSENTYFNLILQIKRSLIFFHIDRKRITSPTTFTSNQPQGKRVSILASPR